MSHGESLSCHFEDMNFFSVGPLYSCEVSSLDNSIDNMTIDGYNGVHEENKNGNGVKGIWIHDTNTKYIPANIGSLFNLTAFQMTSTQLMKIKYMDFHGMQDLVHLGFTFSKLTSVPSDVFSLLTKLKIIYLSQNQIEVIPKDVFSNNPNLEEIHFWGNKIKYLDSGIFNGLTKLDVVNLNDNTCLDKDYRWTEIVELEGDIKLNCSETNDISTTTPLTLITADGMEIN